MDRLKLYNNGEWINAAIAPMGYVGSRGDTGILGNQGVDGYVGSQGYVGSRGIFGYTGSLGSQNISFGVDTYDTSTSTGMSTSAYATKGAIFTVEKNCILRSIRFYVAASQTVKLGVAVLSNVDPGEVLEILYDGPTVTSTELKYTTYEIPNGLFLQQGVIYGFYLTRIDGTPTEILGIAYPGVVPTADSTNTFIYNAGIRLADSNIEIGDQLFYVNTSCPNMRFEFIPQGVYDIFYTPGYAGSTGTRGIVGYQGSYSEISPAARWEEYTDLVTHSLEKGFTQYIVGSGTIGYTAGTSGHPGVVALSTGTATSATAGILKTAVPAVITPQLTVGSGELVFEALIEIVSLPLESDNGNIRLGFMDEIAGAPSNAVQAQLGTGAGGKWGFFCRAGGVSTSSYGTTTATLGWHHVKIVINAAGTSASLIIDGIPELTITTNIPSAGFSYGCQATKSAGSSVVEVKIDLFHVYQTFSTNRY